jgi:N-carbamoyl-L-amino-acid hydrolase
MQNGLTDEIARQGPLLEELFATIGKATGDGVGISRDAYGAAETRAGDILAEFCRRHGLSAAYDRAGNLNVTAPGREAAAPDVIIGSHLDSVPRGGNYDGLAGVIAGIGVLLAVQSLGAAPALDLRVLGFRGEESPWFGQAYLGSRLFLGQLGPAEAEAMRRFDTGRSLADHLKALGATANGEGPLLPLDKARAYLELHIEQGPLLESSGDALAVASAIRGNIRYPAARCHGRYAHSAAVPRHLRADALVATARLIAFADAHWQELAEAGRADVVFTCGMLQTDSAEHAMTKVAGEVSFSLNLGGTDAAVMQGFHEAILARAEKLARQHGVRFDLGTRVGTPPTPLHPGLIARMRAAGAQGGGTVPLMPTVGHDAAMFARAGVPTGMILVRNSHGSHNPAEHMDMADFARGVTLLAQSVLAMAAE